MKSKLRKNSPIRNEARIIIENRDCEVSEEYPTGTSNYPDDWQEATTLMVIEYHQDITISLREKLIEYINEKFQVKIGLDDFYFEHRERKIALLREYFGKISNQIYKGTLRDSPPALFRDMLTDCLRIIPGGIDHFREIQNSTLYLFDIKKTISTLKYYTGLKSDQAFAKFLGFTENTITRAKAGHKTKLHTVLPMLEWLFENATKSKRELFLETFKNED